MEENAARASEERAELARAIAEQLEAADAARRTPSGARERSRGSVDLADLKRPLRAVCKGLRSRRRGMESMDSVLNAQDFSMSFRPYDLHMSKCRCDARSATTSSADGDLCIPFATEFGAGSACCTLDFEAISGSILLVGPPEAQVFKAKNRFQGGCAYGAMEMAM